jgi:hypothetical protein
VDASTVRLVAVDRENNVWVGGTGGDRLHGRLDGQTGQTQFGVGFFDWDTYFSCTQCVECAEFPQCQEACSECVGCEECLECPACFDCPECVTPTDLVDVGGYGGLVDRHGFLWAADGSGDNFLLRFRPDPVDGVFNAESNCIGVPRSYGLGIDTHGDIWVSRWDDLNLTCTATEAFFPELGPGDIDAIEAAAPWHMLFEPVSGNERGGPV